MEDQSLVVLLEIFIHILLMLVQSNYFKLHKEFKEILSGIKLPLFCQIWFLWSGDMIFFVEQCRIVLLIFAIFVCNRV